MTRKAPMPYAAIYAAVLGRIVQGHYRPTHRVGIADLAGSLGVSTTPVREALRQLAGRDIIVERHREGFYLAPLRARTIASLYQAHQHWMDQLLGLSVPQGLAGRPLRNLWRLFDACASQAGDPALSAVRRYLDDRLIVLRGHEAQLLGDMGARGTTFAQALAEQDLPAARRISADFHADCAASADRLAQGFDGSS